jgi:hypothetical protein
MLPSGGGILTGATGRRLQNTCVLKDGFIVRYGVNVEQRVRHKQLVQTTNDLRSRLGGCLPCVANDEGGGEHDCRHCMQ